MLRRFAAFTVFVVLGLPFVPSATAADAAPPVKLAVLVVFDQLRGDYLTRWNDLFGLSLIHI